MAPKINRIYQVLMSLDCGGRVKRKNLGKKTQEVATAGSV